MGVYLCVCPWVWVCGRCVCSVCGGRGWRDMRDLREARQKLTALEVSMTPFSALLLSFLAATHWQDLNLKFYSEPTRNV